VKGIELVLPVGDRDGKCRLLKDKTSVALLQLGDRTNGVLAQGNTVSNPGFQLPPSIMTGMLSFSNPRRCPAAI